MKQLIINDIIITIEKKRIKNMYLRILPPDGRVSITAPKWMKEADIIEFYLSKLGWIQKQQQKLRLNKTKTSIENPQYKTGETIEYKGRNLILEIVNTSSRAKVIINDNGLLLYVKEDSTPEQRKRIIHKWRRDELSKEIPYLLEKWENIIGVKALSWGIKDMKTRWGTCNVKDKRIWLSLQLSKKPLKCLEYVVVHELVHLLERSHNAVFKSYMDHYLPEWRVLKKELNS